MDVVELMKEGRGNVGQEHPSCVCTPLFSYLILRSVVKTQGSNGHKSCFVCLNTANQFCRTMEKHSFSKHRTHVEYIALGPQSHFIASGLLKARLGRAVNHRLLGGVWHVCLILFSCYFLLCHSRMPLRAHSATRVAAIPVYTTSDCMRIYFKVPRRVICNRSDCENWL